MQHLVESSESVWQDEWDEINGVVSLTILPALSCNDNVLGVEHSWWGTSNSNGNVSVSERGLIGARFADSRENNNKMKILTWFKKVSVIYFKLDKSTINLQIKLL